MNNNFLFQSNKISILLATAFLLVSATFVTLYFDQIVMAAVSNLTNSQINNNYSSSNFAYSNISNTSNISLNIIPSFIEIDKVTGQSKIDNKFNVTFSGHGIIKNIPFDGIGFALITPSSADFSRIQGTVHIVDKIGQEKGDMIFSL